MLILAFFCSRGSVHLMDGYVDCHLEEPFFNDAIPALPLPDNCASQVRLLMQTLVAYFAIAFGCLSVLLPIFIRRHQQKSVAAEVEGLQT